ncbi:MAG: NAD-dependent epimerase/dehydratase family protein [Prosthecochloris sp.]|nr:NAD-dependent epimerase/dehydratase family protein [Prosthecochloris sp.]
MDKTVLVTGATGFIGSVLVSSLQRKGYRVRIFLRPESDSRKAEALGAEAVAGRYDDADALRRAVEGVSMVFHLAGVTKSLDEQGFAAGNVMPVRNLLELMAHHGGAVERFLLVSSLAAVGPARSADPGVRESDPPRPVSAYGRSKLEAEKVCMEWSDRLPVTVVRPPAVYGPGDRDVLQFFASLQKRLMLAAGDGRSQRFSLIHVHDLVEGMVGAAISPAAEGQTYFVTSPRGYSWDEVAHAALGELGVERYLKVPLPKPVIHALAAVAGAAGRLTGKPALLNPDKASEMVQDYWVCSPEKARRDFGFDATTSLEEGVRSTIRWYKDAGWL